MPYPTIPETIRVKLGRPNSDAPVITVPFLDYLQNVASSEIYPTWPENALRANILAQASFALNRIYTEWYPSQGYPFDITNSTTVDQAYVQNRDIFDNVAQLVEELYPAYVVRQGSVEPLFTEYCNGTTATCNGLSQWGTVTLANQGKTPYQILQHYYGDDLNIVYDAKIQSPLGSYPDRALRLGEVGNDVRTLQTRLNRISNNYPAIPKIYPVDGVFAKSTEDAVKKFQSVFGLSADGVVGPATWNKVTFLYTAIKKLAELTSEGLQFDEVAPIFPQTLTQGMQNDAVSYAQYYLSVLAAYYPELPPVDIDGIYGVQTTQTVQAVQDMFGLPVTGEIDRATWNQIQSNYQTIVATQPNFITTADVPLFVRTLVLGSSGEDVLQVQQWLTAMAKQYPQITPPQTTAYYGNATQAAVKQAQEILGLAPSGNVTVFTWYGLAPFGRN